MRIGRWLERRRARARAVDGAPAAGGSNAVIGSERT